MQILYDKKHSTHSYISQTPCGRSSLLTVIQLQWDLLQCVVGDGAGAEIGDVVQTHQHSWAAGTGDGRQVAGGPALDTLPLVVLEIVIFRFLATQHSLKM